MSRVNIPRLIFVPALISLGVTILRLAGELGHWSDRWFTSETGGLLPKFFWLAFFPQSVFWVGFTILVGSLSGSIAAAMMPRRKVRATVSA